MDDYWYPDRGLVEDDVEVMAALTVWALDEATGRCTGFAELAEVTERLRFGRAVVADGAEPVAGWQDGKDWPVDEDPAPDSPAVAMAFACLALDSAHEVWAIRNGLTFGYFEEAPGGGEIEVLGSWDPIAQIRLPNDYPSRSLTGFLCIFRHYLGHSDDEVDVMSEMAIWGTSDPRLVDFARSMWQDFDGSVADLRAAIALASSP